VSFNGDRNRHAQVYAKGGRKDDTLALKLATASWVHSKGDGGLEVNEHENIELSSVNGGVTSQSGSDDEISAVQSPVHP
jgi:hypothetical protein